jgi:crossover junction endodeoxyribonuclease RuvC
VRILGVDPSLENVAWAAIDSPESAVYRAVPEGSRYIRTRRADSDARRLHIIAQNLSRDLDRLHPDVVAVEDFNIEQEVLDAILKGSSCHVVGVKGVLQAIGMIKSVCMQHGVEPVMYPPTVVKYTATMRGNAGKDSVIRGVQDILGIDGPAMCNHVADAYAVALTHAVRGSSVLSTRFVDELVIA